LVTGVQTCALPIFMNGAHCQTAMEMLVNWVWTSLGFHRIDWLATHPKFSIISMAVWQWAPFMMLILLAGLQGISDEVREAARIDGAGPLTEFRRITLPLLGPYFELAV